MTEGNISGEGERDMKGEAKWKNSSKYVNR